MQIVLLVIVALSMAGVMILMRKKPVTTQFMVYAMFALALAALGGVMLRYFPWYTEDLGYGNLAAAIYLLLLAVAPAWAAFNVWRTGRQKG